MPPRAAPVPSCPLVPPSPPPSLSPVTSQHYDLNGCNPHASHSVHPPLFSSRPPCLLRGPLFSHSFLLPLLLPHSAPFLPPFSPLPSEQSPATQSAQACLFPISAPSPSTPLHPPPPPSTPLCQHYDLNGSATQTLRSEWSPAAQSAHPSLCYSLWPGREQLPATDPKSSMQQSLIERLLEIFVPSAPCSFPPLLIPPSHLLTISVPSSHDSCPLFSPFLSLFSSHHSPSLLLNRLSVKQACTSGEEVGGDEWQACKEREGGEEWVEIKLEEVNRITAANRLQARRLVPRPSGKLSHPPDSRGAREGARSGGGGSRSSRGYRRGFLVPRPSGKLSHPPDSRGAREGAGSGGGGSKEAEAADSNEAAEVIGGVAWFPDHRAYALSHQTAEDLVRALAVGVVGAETADADEAAEVIGGVKLPSRRPALVSETCLFLSKPVSEAGSEAGSEPPSEASSEADRNWGNRRVRAFHVLDSKGMIDTVGVFVEEREGSGEGAGEAGPDTSAHVSELLEAQPEPPNAPVPPPRLALLLGEWDGISTTHRSPIYGETVTHSTSNFFLTRFEDGSLGLEETRGGLCFRRRGAVANHSAAAPEGTADSEAAASNDQHGQEQQVGGGGRVVLDGGQQITLLPGGLALSAPCCVPRGRAFFFETILAEPEKGEGEGADRQGVLGGEGWRRRRVVRTYDPDGLVVSSSVFAERKIG
ncbi:unnamed protein product [Closterium sp. Naga37s-1]|nr:unnamed protein product [Closterium sp. Naga37s-1]